MLKFPTDSRRVVSAFTAREVAEKMNVHLGTVYRWASGGKIIPIRDGKRIYFPLAALQKIRQNLPS